MSTAFMVRQRRILSSDRSAKLRLAGAGRPWARRRRLELSPGRAGRRPAGERAQDETGLQQEDGPGGLPGTEPRRSGVGHIPSRGVRGVHGVLKARARQALGRCFPDRWPGSAQRFNQTSRGGCEGASCPWLTPSQEPRGGGALNHVAGLVQSAAGLRGCTRASCSRPPASGPHPRLPGGGRLLLTLPNVRLTKLPPAAREPTLGDNVEPANMCALYSHAYPRVHASPWLVSLGTLTGAPT